MRNYIYLLSFILVFLFFINNVLANETEIDKILEINININHEGISYYDYQGRYKSNIAINEEIPFYFLDPLGLWDWTNDKPYFEEFQEMTFINTNNNTQTLNLSILGEHLTDIIYDNETDMYTFSREFVFHEPFKSNHNVTINIFLPYSMESSDYSPYYISLIGFRANIKEKSDYDENLSVISPDVRLNQKLKFSYKKIVQNSKNISIPIAIYYKIVPKEPPLFCYQEDIISIKNENFKTNNFQITNNYNRTLQYAIDTKDIELFQSLYLWDPEILSKPDISYRSNMLDGNGITTTLLTSGIDHALNKQDLKDYYSSWIHFLGYPFDSKVIEWSRDIVPKISDNLIFQMDYQLTFSNSNYIINEKESKVCITPTGFRIPPIRLLTGLSLPGFEINTPRGPYEYCGDMGANITPDDNTSVTFQTAWWYPPNVTIDSNKIYVNGIIINGPYSKSNMGFKIILERPISIYVMFIGIFLGLIFAFSILAYYDWKAFKRASVNKYRNLLKPCALLIIFYIFDFSILREWQNFASFSLIDIAPVIGLVLGISIYKYKSKILSFFRKVRK